tara:strand:+ start:535 stop:759 length:225 start_codon:yes stop_codon:yes gene_type:complete
MSDEDKFDSLRYLLLRLERDYYDIDRNTVSLYLRGLVKSAYMEGFASSKPWRDEDDYWNTSRAKMEIEKEMSDE